MNITVRMVRENEDGSADCDVVFDAEGMQLLLEYGINAVLKEAIKNTKMIHKRDIKRRNVSNKKRKK